MDIATLIGLASLSAVVDSSTGITVADSAGDGDTPTELEQEDAA